MIDSQIVCIDYAHAAFALIFCICGEEEAWWLVVAKWCCFVTSDVLMTFAWGGRQNGKDGTVQSIPLGHQCQAGLSLVSGADPPPSPRCKTVSAFLGSDVGKTGHERTPDNGSTFTARASTSMCIQHSHHFCHCWHGCNCLFGFLQILRTRGISFDIGARLM